MKGFALAAVAAAALVFGYLIMKRLDAFFGGRQEEGAEALDASVLRIGIETAALICSGELLRQIPGSADCELRLYYGSADEIKKGVDTRSLDFGLITDNIDALPEEYSSRTVLFKQDEISFPSAGLSAQPLNKSEKRLRLIWRRDAFLELAGNFQKK